MMTDDQLIERIAVAMHAHVADTFPLPSTLDGIPAPRRPRLTRIAAGSVAPIVGIAVSLAIFVFALVSLGRVSESSAPPSQPSDAGGVPSDESAVIASLKVLRGPQTTADRLPAWVLRTPLQPGDGTIIPSLSRLVIQRARTAFSGGIERDYVVVTALPHRPPSNAASETLGRSAWAC